MTLIAEVLAITPAVTFAQDWTGSYAGLSFGGSDMTATGKPLDNLELEGDGGSTGTFAGYIIQKGNVVYSVEFDWRRRTTMLPIWFWSSPLHG